MISVVIPMYNSKQYIEKTLDSVVSQTYRDIEIIVVDDQSSDGSQEIVQKYCKTYKNITLIKLEKNQGIYNARNVGVANASGNYIAFVDSDDIWLPHKLSTQIEFMQREGKLFSYTAYDFINAEGNNLNKQICVPLSANYKRLLRNNVIGTSTVVISRDLLLRHPMPPIKCEDYACWLEILKTGIIAYGVDTVLCHYRKLKNSDSSAKIRSSKRVWEILRNREKLALPFALYCMLFYIVKGITKHYLPIKKVRI